MKQEKSSYQLSYEEFLEIELPAYILKQENTDEAHRGLVSVARFWTSVWERCMAKEKKINKDYQYIDAIDLCAEYYEYVQRYLQSKPELYEIDPDMPNWEYLHYVATDETDSATDQLVKTMRYEKDLKNGVETIVIKNN